MIVDKNGKVQPKDSETESNSNFNFETARDAEQASKKLKRHEDIPSIINNQLGSEICSPIAKIKGKQIVTPATNPQITSQGDPIMPYIANKIPNNQLFSVNSGENSPKREKSEDDSIEYTERSRSEELSELSSHKQTAFEQYAESKKSFSSVHNNPFQATLNKPDIDPFKQFLESRKAILGKGQAEPDELGQMYDEEAMFMDRITKLKEFRKIIQEYIQLGIKLDPDWSLDDESLAGFTSGVLLCEIVERMERCKIQGVTTDPKSRASWLHNIKKALKILKRRNRIPIYLIYAEQEIYGGNPEIIFELLKSIKYAYKGNGTK